MTAALSTAIDGAYTFASDMIVDMWPVVMVLVGIGLVVTFFGIVRGGS